MVVMKLLCTQKSIGTGKGGENFVSVKQIFVVGGKTSIKICRMGISSLEETPEENTAAIFYEMQDHKLSTVQTLITCAKT